MSLKISIYYILIIACSASSGFYIGTQSLANNTTKKHRRLVHRSLLNSVANPIDHLPQLRSPISPTEIPWDADPQHVYSSILDCQPMPTIEQVSKFFGDWAKTNPQSAFSSARNLPGRFFAYRFHIYSAMFEAGLASDPFATLNWINSLQHAVVAFTASEAWIQEPEKIAPLIAELRPGNVSKALARCIAKKWGRDDFEAALNWSRSLPKELAVAPMGELMNLWASNDIEAAKSFISTEAKSQERQALLDHLISIYAKSDPIAALEWGIETLGNTHHFGYVFEVWAREDSAAATDYVLSIENPQHKKEILTVLSRNYLAYKGFPESSSWLMSMPTDDRAIALASSFKKLFQANRDGAVALLSTLEARDINAEFVDRAQFTQIIPDIGIKWAEKLPSPLATQVAVHIVRQCALISETKARTAIDALEVGVVRMAAESALNELSR